MFRFVVLISFAVSASAGKCALFNREKWKADLIQQHNVSSVLSVNASLGPYSVKHGKILNIPGLSFGKPHSGVIFYPEAKDPSEKFPFLSFAHGTFVGGTLPPVATSYLVDLETVASHGFIIVAPESCPKTECFTAYSKDQLATIAACKANPRLHPALASANFDIVGVFGHSMGGMATLGSSGGLAGVNPEKYNIKAAVAQHPCWDIEQRPSSVSVPIMFTSGSADTICQDGCAEHMYDVVKTPSILFNVKGATHFEPTDIGKNREDKAVALFFSCWLRNENCDEVYGSNGRKICTDITGGTLSECKVKGKKTTNATTHEPTTVTIDEVTIGGLKCDGIQSGTVIYPKDASASKKYPLLSFAHGWTEGGSLTPKNYAHVLQEVSASGYIVVAEHSGLELLCYAAEKHDQIRAIDYIKETKKYADIVDWNVQVGLYGHSMGGAASGLNAADPAIVSKYNIGAAVCLHPAQGGQGAASTVPTFFFTGSADKIVPPLGVWSMYEKAKGPKVYAEIKGANHFECQTFEDGIPCPHAETQPVIDWMNCYIKNVTSACDSAFGVCKGPLPMANCVVKR